PGMRRLLPARPRLPPPCPSPFSGLDERQDVGDPSRWCIVLSREDGRIWRTRMLRILAIVAAIAFAPAPDAARAEAKTLRVAKQFGVAYMQFMVLEDQKLIEKHAKAAGLGDITVEFNQFRSSDVMNDALISGSVDFVS